jgi:poly(glycerol-phosphate) alpha-glucosyltransferase
MIKTANLTGSISRNAGGLYESVRRLVQSLHAGGMTFQVFGIEDEHTRADIGAWAPVPVQAFRSRFGKQFGYAPGFRKALENFAPDITHTHGLWLYSSIATNQSIHRRGVPCVISAHGMLDPWAVRNSYWKKAVAHFLYEGEHLRNASCLRALCESEARAIRQFGLKNPIAIIPNGIDLPEIKNAGILKSDTQKAEESRAPWENFVYPGKKVLLFLSRIHPKKGLINLLKAWAKNRQSRIKSQKSNDWVLAIAGWDQGGHEAELKQLCMEIQLPFTDIRVENSKRPVEISSPVLFLGPQFRAAKAACYQHCDGFVLPSFSEGVPMVVLEAWAYSKPVIMTPECNLPSGFTHQAAIRIETTPESIADGLQEFFQRSELERHKLGANGFRLVQEEFAWPVLGREMAQLYGWILGGGDKPRCLVDF